MSAQNIEYPYAFVYDEPGTNNRLMYQVIVSNKKRLTSNDLNKLRGFTDFDKIDPQSITFVTQKQINLLDFACPEYIRPFNPTEIAEFTAKKVRRVIDQQD